MQKRDSKSFDTGQLHSRCHIDDMDSNVVENRFMAATAAHQSCDDGFFNDKNKINSDTNQRGDAGSGYRPNDGGDDDGVKNNEAESQNEVRKRIESWNVLKPMCCVGANRQQPAVVS